MVIFIITFLCRLYFLFFNEYKLYIGINNSYSHTLGKESSIHRNIYLFIFISFIVEEELLHVSIYEQVLNNYKE
jgi:hypothetical protein